MPRTRCAGCPRTEDPIVPGSGPSDAVIAVVGERPGRIEVRTGRPFTGQAGQLFDETLYEAGIPPESIFRTNTCICYHPQNKAPRPGESRTCYTHLMEELGSLPNLKMVVALGSVATKALLDTRKGVTWMRGRIMEFPGLGCDFAATWHPASALPHRDPTHREDIVFDLRRVAEHLNGTGPKEVPLDYYLAKTEDDALQIIDACREAETFSIDFETDSEERPDFNSDRVLQINLCWAPGQAGVIRCIHWGGEKGFRAAPAWTPRVEEALKDLFTSSKYFRILANGKFDSKFAHSLLGTRIKVDFDTMLAHLMFDERRGTHALYSVASRYVGIDTWEHLIQPYLPTKKTPFSAVPMPELAKYGARDADCEYRCGWKFADMLKEQPFERLYYEVILPASEAFTVAEVNGITVDVKYANRLGKDLEKRLTDAQEKLSFGGRVNLRSPKQVAAVLYDELELPIPEEGRTTRKDALEKLRHKSDYAEELLDFREADKLHGTYLKKLIEKALQHELYLVFMDYQLHGTVTGRLSETGARVMTIPRESWMRRIFVARDGYEFLRLDYSGAEVCWVGVYSQDPDLTNIINSGRHIHTEVAMEMFRHTSETWAALDEDTRTHLKIIAKSVVFGLLYGRGPVSIAEQFEVSVEEAKSYIRRFFSQFPGVEDWMSRVQWEAIRKKELTTVYGRKRRFGASIPEEYRHVVKRQAVNFLPSSSSNDMTLTTYVRVYKQLELAGPVYLHDGVLWEVPEGTAVQVAPDIRKIAERVDVDTKVRFRVDLAHGKSWGDLEAISA